LTSASDLRISEIPRRYNPGHGRLADPSSDSDWWHRCVAHARRALQDSDFTPNGPALQGHNVMKDIVFTQQVYDLPYITEPSIGIYSYYDLRRHPERIDEIPELKSDPALKSFVSVLNEPAGLFMTHGCDVSRRRPGCEGYAIPIPDISANARCWYSSYVTFSLWTFDENKEERYRAIHDLYTPEENDGSVCFEVQPVSFLSAKERRLSAKFQETNGMACLIWASGWGDNFKQSYGRWSRSIHHLTEFFQNSRFPQWCGFANSITVSQYMALD
jgi:hypothetical protein